jgi:hypothetical protein
MSSISENATSSPDVLLVQAKALSALQTLCLLKIVETSRQTVSNHRVQRNEKQHQPNAAIHHIHLRFHGNTAADTTATDGFITAKGTVAPVLNSLSTTP